MLYIQVSSQPIQVVCDRLRYAAGIHGMPVVSVQDLKQRLTSRGVEFHRACRVYELCDARRMRDLLDYSMSAASVLPVRVSVYEEHGRVKVAAMRPSTQLSLFGAGAALRSIGEELDRMVTAIVDATVRENVGVDGAVASTASSTPDEDAAGASPASVSFN